MGGERGKRGLYGEPLSNLPPIYEPQRCRWSLDVVQESRCQPEKAEKDPGSCCDPARGVWIEAAAWGHRALEKQSRKLSSLQYSFSSEKIEPHRGQSIPASPRNQRRSLRLDTPLFFFPSESG